MKYNLYTDHPELASAPRCGMVYTIHKHPHREGFGGGFAQDNYPYINLAREVDFNENFTGNYGVSAVNSFGWPVKKFDNYRDAKEYALTTLTEYIKENGDGW